MVIEDYLLPTNIHHRKSCIFPNLHAKTRLTSKIKLNCRVFFLGIIQRFSIIIEGDNILCELFNYIIDIAQYSIIIYSECKSQCSNLYHINIQWCPFQYISLFSVILNCLLQCIQVLFSAQLFTYIYTYIHTYKIYGTRLNRTFLNSLALYDIVL